MKKSELKQLIREVIEEAKTPGFVVVDLDRGHGAFWAGDDRITAGDEPRSPLNPDARYPDDVEGQWEHILDANGGEIGGREGWETHFSIFHDQQKALAWAAKWLKGKVNPVTGKPYRFQVLSYPQWGRELNRNLKSTGKPVQETQSESGGDTRIEDEFGSRLEKLTPQQKEDTAVIYNTIERFIKELENERGGKPPYYSPTEWTIAYKGIQMALQNHGIDGDLLSDYLDDQAGASNNPNDSDQFEEAVKLSEQLWKDARK